MRSIEVIDPKPSRLREPREFFNLGNGPQEERRGMHCFRKVEVTKRGVEFRSKGRGDLLPKVASDVVTDGFGQSREKKRGI